MTILVRYFIQYIICSVSLASSDNRHLQAEASGVLCICSLVLSSVIWMIIKKFIFETWTIPLVLVKHCVSVCRNRMHDPWCASSDTRSGIEGVMEVCDVSLVKTSLDLELLLPSFQLLKCNRFLETDWERNAPKVLMSHNKSALCTFLVAELLLWLKSWGSEFSENTIYHFSSYDAFYERKYLLLSLKSFSKRETKSIHLFSSHSSHSSDFFIYSFSWTFFLKATTDFRQEKKDSFWIKDHRVKQTLLFLTPLPLSTAYLVLQMYLFLWHLKYLVTFSYVWWKW